MTKVLDKLIPWHNSLKKKLASAEGNKVAVEHADRLADSYILDQQIAAACLPSWNLDTEDAVAAKVVKEMTAIWARCNRPDVAVAAAYTAELEAKHAQWSPRTTDLPLCVSFEF